MTVHKFQEFADQVMADPERRASVERERQEALAEIVQYTLSELRKRRSVTQEELAEILGIKQSSISRLEHADTADAQLGTLRSYIEALGGTIEVTAVFGSDRFPLSLE